MLEAPGAVFHPMRVAIGGSRGSIVDCFMSDHAERTRQTWRIRLDWGHEVRRSVSIVKLEHILDRSGTTRKDLAVVEVIGSCECNVSGADNERNSTGREAEARNVPRDHFLL